MHWMTLSLMFTVEKLHGHDFLLFNRLSPMSNLGEDTSRSKVSQDILSVTMYRHMQSTHIVRPTSPLATTRGGSKIAIASVPRQRRRNNWRMTRKLRISWELMASQCLL